jgi:penicillin-binding protein 2
MTYLFAPDQAMKTLTALEEGWGGDLATRMAKKAASYAPTPDPAAVPAEPGASDTRPSPEPLPGNSTA